MHWSQYRLEKDKSVTQGATTTIDLPESGMLSAIIVQIQGFNANGLTAIPLQRLIDHITKVEVTDGGTKTLESLTGIEQRASNFYRLGKTMPESFDHYNLKKQWTSFVILFGRKLYDKKYMLDLGVWDDVDLEITNDLTTTYMQDSVVVNVDLVMAHDMPAPPSYIKAYEWKKEIADKDTDWIDVKIPTLDPIRRMMFMTQPHLHATTGAPTNDPYSDSYIFELSYKEYSEQVFYHRPRDLYRMNKMIFGGVETALRGRPSTTLYFDTQIAYVESLKHTFTGDTVITAVDAAQFHDDYDRFQRYRVAIDAGDISQVTAKGMGYLHTWCIPYDLEDDPTMFLNPAKGAKGPVHVKWYAHTDDHDFRTVLEVNKAQGMT